MSKLILVRGLPGSGKSTFAKTFGCLHVEADMFYIVGGKYRFDGTEQKPTPKGVDMGIFTVLS